MPEYRVELLGNEYYGKFIRTQNTIHITRPELEGMQDHDIFAREEGLVDKIKELIDSQPTALDAGSIGMTLGGDILIHRDSSKLKLPVDELAREITGEVFQTQSPGHEVVIEAPHFIYSRTTRREY